MLPPGTPIGAALALWALRRDSNVGHDEGIGLKKFDTAGRPIVMAVVGNSAPNVPGVQLVGVATIVQAIGY